VVRGQLHTVSGIDCIPISIYAVPAWIGFLILSREQYGQINAFLNSRCGFSCELIVIALIACNRLITSTCSVVFLF